MRVLVGMPDGDSLGGPAACEPPFVAELRRQGVEVALETYVYGERPGGTGHAERVRRVLEAARRLKKRLAATRFDLLHLNTSFDTKALVRDAATVTLLGRRSGARLFLKFHGSDGALLETSNPLLRSAARVLFARADGLGLLSSEELENFARAGVPREKLFVVKNVVAPREAIDEADSMSKRRALAERLGTEADVPVLLFIARLIPAKGLLDVIRACRILRERGHAFLLACVGDGPARAEAESETERLGLRERVRFTGLVPEGETAAFYEGSTALVFPTYHYEGFPMVVFHSVASGLPVITTRIRAAADYLREPDNCLWVEPRDPAAVAEKIAHLIERPDLRAKMSANNRRLAQSFTAEPVTREYFAAYERIIGDSRDGQDKNRQDEQDKESEI